MIPRKVQEQADNADRILQEMSKEAIPPEVEDDPEVDEIEEVKEEPKIDWEHRYNVLQGKYNAEVPRLNQELQSLKDQYRETQQKVEDLSRKPEPTYDLNNIRDELGDDTANALSSQQQTIDALRQQIEELKGHLTQVGTNQQTSAEQSFYITLEQLVPDWKKVNTQAKFIDWLQVEDEFSGRTRQELLDTAARNLDARRVASFFTGWKRSNPKTQNIESVASPNTSKANRSVQEKQTYTRGEVKQFYDDVARGKYRHDEEKRKKLDFEYTMAQAEGRIR